MKRRENKTGMMLLSQNHCRAWFFFSGVDVDVSSAGGRFGVIT
jgi:hypothetical protein